MPLRRGAAAGHAAACRAGEIRITGTIDGVSTWAWIVVAVAIWLPVSVAVALVVGGGLRAAADGQVHPRRAEPRRRSEQRRHRHRAA